MTKSTHPIEEEWTRLRSMEERVRNSIIVYVIYDPMRAEPKEVFLSRAGAMATMRQYYDHGHIITQARLLIE